MTAPFFNSVIHNNAHSFRRRALSDKLELGQNIDPALTLLPLGVAPMEADRAYYESRAGEERVAALKAHHCSARQAHLELAGRYDCLVSVLIDQERYFALSLIKGATAA